MIKNFNEIPRRKERKTNKQNKNKKIKFQVFLLLFFCGFILFEILIP